MPLEDNFRSLRLSMGRCSSNSVINGLSSSDHQKINRYIWCHLWASNNGVWMSLATNYKEILAAKFPTNFQIIGLVCTTNGREGPARSSWGSMVRNWIGDVGSKPYDAATIDIGCSTWESNKISVHRPFGTVYTTSIIILILYGSERFFSAMVRTKNIQPPLPPDIGAQNVHLAKLPSLTHGDDKSPITLSILLFEVDLDIQTHLNVRRLRYILQINKACNTHI